MTARTLRAASTLLLVVAIACRKEAPPAPTLTVTPATADIAPNSAPVTFTATQTRSSAAVSWSIVPGSCASPGSVDSTTGVYTPPATNDVACTLRVRATAGPLIADATVNLSALSATGATLRVTPTSGSVTAGSSAPFTFYVDSSDTVTTATCTLSPALGTCTASSPGTHTHAFDVTAPAGLLKSTTAVQATITVGTLSGLVAVTVQPSVLIVSGPTTVTAGGGTAAYSVSSPDVTGETVVWSVAPPIGSISAAGVYTPPASLQQSTTVDVVATIGGARGTLSVQLLPLPAGTAAAGLLAMFSAIDAKALECEGWGFGADEWSELNAVAASVQSAVDAGRLAYDAAAQATCLASIEATTCLQILHYVDFGECIVSAFTGKVAQGGQCSESVECAAGYCAFPTGTCPGTCAPRTPLNGPCSADEQCAAGLVCANYKCSSVTVVGNGATCDSVSQVCAATSYCMWAFLSSSCVPLGAAGSPCFQPSECIASLTCNGLTGTCTQYAARNQACGSTAWCNGYTDYCTQGGICGALPTLGQSCAYAGRCTWDYWCDSSLAVPTCVAYPTLGQQCAGAPYCQGQAFCDRLLAVPTCVAYPTLGQPCPRGTCTADAYCDGSLATPTCVARKTSGSCKYSGECATGYYCDGNYPTPGNCRPQGAAGAACSNWDQCQTQLDCIGGICSVTGCY